MIYLNQNVDLSKGFEPKQEIKGKFHRRSAIKKNIKSIVSGDYIQEDEQTPNYLLTKDGKRLYRVNLISIVVNKENVGNLTNVLLDDGSGKIVLRCFENNKNITEVNLGEALMVIGKVRIFNEEKYISPEIIKIVDRLWLKVRLLELKKEEPLLEEEHETVKNEPANGKKLMEEKVEEEPIENNESLPFEKVISIIKDLDNGEGVRVEEIIEKSTLGGTEEIIEKMIENGEIFQNQPGKVKVL